MPNIKSAKKRVKINAKKALKNQIVKNTMRTELKKFDAVVAEGDEAARKAALARVTKCVDKAVAKGILHKNTAARTKSRLAKKAAV
ncbi:MAG: 30S ribosomal protein S20 [Clostridia bacterium]|nr:30S ribosomal protein S20 [Clostridia bacterium]MBQ6000205.1 30S ribosomal protein S20 [Clostridia bacterium]MBQ6059565.1 30S ribosomal protein S20 [Clostridia bacterium]